MNSIQVEQSIQTIPVSASSTIGTASTNTASSNSVDTKSNFEYLHTQYNKELVARLLGENILLLSIGNQAVENKAKIHAAIKKQVAHERGDLVGMSMKTEIERLESQHDEMIGYEEAHKDILQRLHVSQHSSSQLMLRCLLFVSIKYAFF
jgi:hypothetical protein